MKFKSKWTLIVLLFFCGTFIGVILKVRAPRLIVREGMRAVNAQDVARSGPLQYAAQKYKERGGKYIWGLNDCSVFVSDYLLKLPFPPKTRLTTAALDVADVEQFGLKIEVVPAEGDVLNYRYRSERSDGMAGHCGVVVQNSGKLCVMHNCSTRGLVIQPISDFYATAKSLGVDKYSVTVLRPRKS